MFTVVDITRAHRKEHAMLKPVATVALVLASLLATSGLAHRQSSVATRPGFELLVPSGTMMPTGVRVRLEVRDYLTWVTPLGAAATTRRNDVAVLAGLRLALR
jgi:hypothetical protein